MRRLNILILMILISGLLVACGDGDSDEGQGDQEAAQPATTTMAPAGELPTQAVTEIVTEAPELPEAAGTEAATSPPEEPLAQQTEIPTEVVTESPTEAPELSPTASPVYVTPDPRTPTATFINPANPLQFTPTATLPADIMIAPTRTLPPDFTPPGGPTVAPPDFVVSPAPADTLAPPATATTVPRPPASVRNATPLLNQRDIGPGQMIVTDVIRPGETLINSSDDFSAPAAPSGSAWVLVEVLVQCDTTSRCVRANNFSAIGQSGTTYPIDLRLRANPGLFTQFFSGSGSGFVGFVVPNSEAVLWLVVTVNGTDYAFALQ